MSKLDQTSPKEGNPWANTPGTPASRPPLPLRWPNVGAPALKPRRRRSRRRSRRRDRPADKVGWTGMRDISWWVWASKKKSCLFFWKILKSFGWIYTRGPCFFWWVLVVSCASGLRVCGQINAGLAATLSSITLFTWKIHRSYITIWSYQKHWYTIYTYTSKMISSSHLIILRLLEIQSFCNDKRSKCISI